MPNLEEFDLTDMAQLSAVLRKVGNGAASMEDAASRATRCLYDLLLDGRGERACALVRLFKTHEYGGLPLELQAFARRAAGKVVPWPRLRCLTLLATAGMLPAWNARSDSQSHQAIPLISEETINAAPMVASLVRQLGLDVRQLLASEPGLFLENASSSYNVFHVPDVHGSAMVPAQDGFVTVFGIRSVIGFGGVMPSGDMYAMILFTRVTVDAETAQLFKTLSLSLRLAITVHERRVFT